MIIHFICSGNAYRSRLAEAYLNSKKLEGLEVISSGIRAERNTVNGPVAWLAERIIENNGWVEFMSLSKKQTTQEMIAKSDLLIFMEPVHFEYCKEHMDREKQRYEIWNVLDIDKFVDDYHVHSFEKDIVAMKFSEATFETIKQKIDSLELG
jgi:protein-tyrosine-phosphatase